MICQDVNKMTFVGSKPMITPVDQLSIQKMMDKYCSLLAQGANIQALRDSQARLYMLRIKDPNDLLENVEQSQSLTFEAHQDEVLLQQFFKKESNDLLFKIMQIIQEELGGFPPRQQYLNYRDISKIFEKKFSMKSSHSKKVQVLKKGDSQQYCMKLAKLGFVTIDNNGVDSMRRISLNRMKNYWNVNTLVSEGQKNSFKFIDDSDLQDIFESGKT